MNITENQIWKLLIEYFRLEKYNVDYQCVRMTLRDQRSKITVLEKTEKGFFDRTNYEMQVSRQVDGKTIKEEDFLFDNTSIDVSNLIELEREYGTRRRCIKLHSLTGYEKILITGRCIGFPNSNTLRVYIISSIETA